MSPSKPSFSKPAPEVSAQQVEQAISILNRWAQEHSSEPQSSESQSSQPQSSQPMDRGTMRAAVGAATKLYSQAVEQAGRELQPVDADITTTDAVRLSVALLRSQGLTPFEMAMWFGKSSQEADQQEAPE